MNVTDAIWEQMQKHPASPAIYYAGKEISFGDLQRIVKKLVRKLGNLGVRAGDSVAVCSLEPALYLALALAIARSGAVFSSINAVWPDSHKAQMVRRHSVGWIIQDDEDPWNCPEAGTVRRANVSELLAALRENPSIEEMACPGKGSDVWRISHSSGTTGSPKSVPWTHEADIKLQELQLRVFPAGPGSRLLIFADIRIALSLVNSLMQLRSGGAVIFPSRSNADELHRIFSAERPQRMLSTPALVEKALDSAAETNRPFDCETTGLQMITLGGSAIPPALLRKIKQSLCSNVQIGYGATEIGTMALADAGADLQLPGSAGVLVPWIEAEVLGDDAHLLPQGQAGELRFRSPAHANAYLEDPDQDVTSTGFRDGWYYPGDMGWITRDRVLILAGRNDHRININGVKVDPARIEEVLTRQAGVQAAGVVAATEPGGKTILVAAIVADKSTRAVDLARICAEQLGASHVPKRFVLIKALPRTPMGKLDRATLKTGLDHLLRASPGT